MSPSLAARAAACLHHAMRSPSGSSPARAAAAALSCSSPACCHSDHAPSTSGRHHHHAHVGLPWALMPARRGIGSSRVPHAAMHGSMHAGQSWLPSWASIIAQQVRGYKSGRKSLRPSSVAASWKAVAPLLPPPPPGGRSTQAGPIVDSAIPPVPAVPKPEEHVVEGVLTGAYTLELQPAFAVVEIAGSQWKVTRDDVLFVNQLRGVHVNDVLRLDRVLLLGSKTRTVIGRPYIPHASVLVAVEEHFRDGKVHVFKKKRRKRYRRYMSERAHLTTLRVLDVRGMDADTLQETSMQAPLPIAWGAQSGTGLANAPSDDDDDSDDDANEQVQQ